MTKTQTLPLLVMAATSFVAMYSMEVPAFGLVDSDAIMNMEREDVPFITRDFDRDRKVLLPEYELDFESEEAKREFYRSTETIYEESDTPPQPELEGSDPSDPLERPDSNVPRLEPKLQPAESIDNARTGTQDLFPFDLNVITHANMSADTSQEYVWTTVYGVDAPRKTTYRGHEGKDMTGLINGQSNGTPIIAIRSGKVTASGWNKSYGWRLAIQHSDGTQILYGHMLQAPTIPVGASVTAGTEIGKQGNTGNSSGTHLHIHAQAPGTLVGLNGQNNVYVDIDVISPLFDNCDLFGTNHVPVETLKQVFRGHY